MKSSNMRKAIFGGLIAVLAAWYVLPRWLGRAAPALAGAAEETEVSETTEPAPQVDRYAEAQAALREQRAAATVAWPANPFVLTVVASDPVAPATGESANAAQPVYVLKGIITGVPARALLNDQVVGVGDELADGSTILSIDANSLTLQSPKGHVVVRLEE